VVSKNLNLREGRVFFLPCHKDISNERLAYVIVISGCKKFRVTLHVYISPEGSIFNSTVLAV